MLITEHQRNEFGIGNTYAFDIIVYGADKAAIGLVMKASVPDEREQYPEYGQQPAACHRNPCSEPG